MWLLILRIITASLLGVKVLAGTNPGARQLAPTDCVCTLDIRPVCSSIGVTFDNSCLAACVGATVTDNGPCTDDDLSAPGPTNPECVCTLDIRPVCGADGQTYENTCLALCQGVTIVSLGSCADTSVSPLPATTPSTEDLCVCTLDIRPVCGTDGQTYENACLAQCAGVTIVNLGPCNGTSTTPTPPVCDCTLDIRPVCGSDGETYDNACLAGCEGIIIIALGPCSDLTSTVVPGSTTSASSPITTATTPPVFSTTPSIGSASTAPSTGTSPLVSSTTINPASRTTPSLTSSTATGSPLTSLRPTTAVSATSPVTASSSGATFTTASTGATFSTGFTASTSSPRGSTTYSPISSYLNNYNVTVQPSDNVGSSTTGPTSSRTSASSSATTSYHIQPGTRINYSLLSKL